MLGHIRNADGYQTWQIDAGGVRLLKSLGVGSDGKFSMERFMDLWARGIVYTGTRPPIQADEPLPVSPDDLALHERSVALYEALYNLKLEDAYTFLHPNIRAEKTLAQFKPELMGTKCCRLTGWKIQSCRSGQVNELPEVIGSVVVDLKIQDASGHIDRLDSRHEFWIQAQGQWYWIMPRNGLQAHPV